MWRDTDKQRRENRPRWGGVGGISGAALGHGELGTPEEPYGETSRGQQGTSLKLRMSLKWRLTWMLWAHSADWS